MRKMSKTRFIAAAALAGSAGLAVVAPAAIAGAGAPKPPTEVTCSSLLGSATEQLQSGCVGTAKAHTTAYGVSVPNNTDTAATIFWTNKDTTTISIASSSVTNDCGTYLGVAANLKEQSVSTVTGGNSKLTLESNISTVCVYISGSQILVVGGSSTL